jgi:excisionase family DNA binding protein
MKDKATDRYVPVQTVMEVLSCKEDHVYDLIRNGSLTAIKLGKRALRVSEQSLRAFIAASRVDPAEYLAPADPDPEQTRMPPKVARSNWMIK